jgi:hypothetical protein
MTSIEEQWPKGTPERVLADAFSAFRRRDAARLAAEATAASIRALAARVGPELDARDSRTPPSSTGGLTDSEAATILGRLIARLPDLFTDSVRCLIVGHVLDSRLVDASPDGRGLICFDCRVNGADDAWLSVHGDRQIHRELANRAAGLAHVVFRVAHEFPGRGIVPFPPELQVATTQLVGGEWKLVLDEWSDVGLPGFRGVGFWIDEGSTTEAAAVAERLFVV